jgi:uncharacterized protein (TIGR02611 family)
MHSFGTLLRFIWRSSKRAVVFVVGVVLMVVGLIMFVTPGPGIVLLVAGLAVLATEFAWAEHLLDKAKEQAAKAGKSATKIPGVSRATSAVGTVVVRVVPRRWRRGGGDSEADVEVDEVVEITQVEITQVEITQVEIESGGDDEARRIVDVTEEGTEQPAGRLPSGHRARRSSAAHHRLPDGETAVDVPDADRRR